MARTYDHRKALLQVRTIRELVEYLRVHLDWPLADEPFDDLVYDYEPEDLGIDAGNKIKIRKIQKLRPVIVKQPWGIFFIEFEPKRLPVVALRRILSGLVKKKRETANPADQGVWARDDLIFISNYGEADKRQITFAHFCQPDGKAELPTLKVIGWDDEDTLLHLDHCVAELNKLKWPERDDFSGVDEWRRQWRGAFTLGHREVIQTSKALAVALAALARKIRRRIVAALQFETNKGPLTRLMLSFQQALIHDLKPDDFADMYAQTITYGMLSARIANPQRQTHEGLLEQIPVTNPFLKELLATFLDVGGRKTKRSGPALDFDELGVNDVAELLDSPKTHMDAVLRDFGNKNAQEDPVIHFYELFLKEYDAKKRMQRGVFYTPRPVVSYIVRSVHELLQTEFGLEDGLADTVTWGEMQVRMPDVKLPQGVAAADRFVTILDPATGTGTFLVEVIDVVYSTLEKKWQAAGKTKQIDELWNAYVPAHLLPRLHGYELQMAPYAIAHVKVGLKLYETGYRFGSDERARVYLTNALEPASDLGQMRMTGILPALANEAEAVNAVKRRMRFTVVLGNPPYSNFGQLNRIPWILNLLDDYKRGLNEKKLNLDDDFIKFLRFSHHVLAATGVGAAGLITNNSYFDGITHRRMRQTILNEFSVIEMTDLRGSTVKDDRDNEGEQDQNVFDIQQGVGICVLGKLTRGDAPLRRHTATVGQRPAKHEWLRVESRSSVRWRDLSPTQPHFFFAPKNFEGKQEYDDFISVRDLMPVGSSAIQTKRDALFVDIDRRDLADRMRDVLARGPTAKMQTLYPLQESPGWSPDCLAGATYGADKINPVMYRPFDRRFVYYDDHLLGRSRITCFRHLLKPNIALATLRQTVDDSFRHVFCVNGLCDINLTIGHHVSDQVFPLFLYEEGLLGARRPNLAMRLLGGLTRSADLRLVEHERGDLRVTVGPRDIFEYVYAVLHSPTYRTRYAEFLKIDFPRIPLTAIRPLFHALANLGADLVAFHLVEHPLQLATAASYLPAAHTWHTQVTGGHKLPLSLHFLGPALPPVTAIGWSAESVWLDFDKKTQRGTIGFHGVPEHVWKFHIGGYQVCEKWLKDRRGRTLTPEDVTHYLRIVIALHATSRLMAEIDVVIDAHGGWPAAFHSEEGKPAESPSPNRSEPPVQTVAAKLPPRAKPRAGNLFEDHGPLFGGMQPAIDVGKGEV